MNRPSLDIAALAIGLVAVGFAVVLLLAGHIASPLIQPILAVTLAAAGTIGLLATRGRTTNRKEQS
ncbi:hypothetical protein H5392_12125 [Tessaracoccus sp. MC1865]|uniref:hypothetical protein n=1 Tax=Tessaracoccus sp. MC1865 TaxID=2760310 RepID=UPI001600B2A9|nr:hypothetical protein [Tessaracoccus sp. MC1865]MBB1484601.1 hypothetical protein [Tessaracoccus sp. MC1865]QTO38311.1 hypothetical protein J7D54_04210 [Tessaracoccus sp. MC1865]